MYVRADALERVHGVSALTMPHANIEPRIYGGKTVDMTLVHTAGVPGPIILAERVGGAGMASCQ